MKFLKFETTKHDYVGMAHTWIEALFFHKQQQKALGSQVKTPTKEKKEKEDVLTYLELVNMKNVSLSQFEKLKGNTTVVEKEKLLDEFVKKILDESATPTSIVGNGIGTQEEFEPSQCQEKTRGL